MSKQKKKPPLNYQYGTSDEMQFEASRLCLSTGLGSTVIKDLLTLTDNDTLKIYLRLYEDSPEPEIKDSFEITLENEDE